VRNRQAGTKTFVYTRVANFGDFSPKKANLGILLKNALAKKTNIPVRTFKVLPVVIFKNFGLHPCFHRT
jgi:hypothetical protein